LPKGEKIRPDQNQAAVPNQGEKQNAALQQEAFQPTMQMGGM
jgi:hypothetical protein